MNSRQWQARERLSEQRATADHHPECTWPFGQPCLKFSTDGTRLGAEIAHMMGMTSEAAIADVEWRDTFVSDVDEEQADWDAEDS